MNNETLELIQNAERYLLGQCLQDGGVLNNPFSHVRGILNSSDFLTTNHQLIFEAISSVYSADDPISAVSVAMCLSKNGDLNRVGGEDYLYELQAPIVESESAEFYAKQVKDASIKRRMGGIGDKIKALAADDSLSAVEIMSKVNLELENIDTSHNTFESMTAEELSKLELPPVKWIVPGLIPDGLTVLAGDAKIGKSFFAWNIAIAVAMGGVALSNIDIEQSRNVTYLALEDPPALLQERLLSLTDGDVPANIHIINDMHNIKIDAFGLKTVAEHIDKTGSELVIVDTWKHVAPVIQENGTSYDIDYKRLIPVQKFADAKGISMILVTHTRKAHDLDNRFNQIQGSMGIQAGCDTMLMITRDTGGHSLHVTGRRVVQDEYAIRLTEGGIWELEGRVNDVRKTKSRQIIIEMLTDAGDAGLRATDIITNSGKQKEVIRQTLRRMVKDGDIQQPSPRGKYYVNGRETDDDEI